MLLTNVDTDQTVRMRRLILVYAGRKRHKSVDYYIRKKYLCQ